MSGCVSTPYEFGENIESPNTLELPANESQIERGNANVWVDRLGHYFLSLPSKLILLNWRVDNHNISAETEDKLVQYLKENDMPNVKVRLNQYAPGREWRRLFRNKSVGAGWRYTLGMLSVSLYTIMPGRAFGGANFNPFTNTINLYSDHNSIAIHEAGHAKDFAKRKYKGTYSALRLLPIVPLYQEALASSDAIGYDRKLGDIEDEKADYKILYPAYCTYISGDILRWTDLPIWSTYAINLGATIPGHIIGRIKAARVENLETASSRFFEKTDTMEANGWN